MCSPFPVSKQNSDIANKIPNDNIFINRQFYETTTDANDMISFGMYGYNPSCSNIPAPDTYGYILSFSYGEWLNQIAISTNTDPTAPETKLKMRKNINGGGWMEWQDI